MGIECCNEIDLIQQTLAGKTSAFDQLVKMHRRTIYVLVLSYVKNSADAEDLTQRIFIRAYERLATLRESDCFLPWLQQIAHNTCKDWLRRRRELVASLEVAKSSDFSETAPSAEDIVLKAEVENIVRKAIDGLKETDRKLMEGHYIEGASYDELRAESGLSYAAIANRLKRAKREVRRRVRRLLGGVMIVPSQTFIWGGFEIVKLSVKAKLAAVAVTAAIGIGGGSVLYHHTAQLGPIVVNEQEVSEARMVAMDPSTDISSTTYNGTVGRSLTNEISVNQTSQINRFEIAESTRDDGAKIVEARYMGELPDEIKDFIHTLTVNLSDVGGDGAVLDAGTTTIQAEPEELPEDVRQAIETLIKQSFVGIQASEIEVNTETGELTQSFTEKITSGEVPVNFVIQRPRPSTSTDSLPQSTVTAATVESTTIPSGPSKENTPFADEEWAEFERLLSVSGEFSDEEWTELERLLDKATGRTTPQRDRHTPPNFEQQPNVERIPETPPTTPSERQEMWRQRPDLPESNSDVPPYPTTEEWRRTME